MSESASLSGPDELASLYRACAPSLRRLVASGTRVPDAIVDDACQVAWMRLLVHRGRVGRRAALSWLMQTAVHEALRLARQGRHETSLEALREGADGGEGWGPWLGEDRTDEVVLRAARMQVLQRLAPRQQRLVWLRACGLSYREIAAATGDSPRTVERQLLRARARLGAEDPAGPPPPAPTAAPGRACGAAAPPD